jgi:hypothetical protein
MAPQTPKRHSRAPERANGMEFPASSDSRGLSSLVVDLVAHPPRAALLVLPDLGSNPTQQRTDYDRELYLEWLFYLVPRRSKVPENARFVASERLGVIECDAGRP